MKKTNHSLLGAFVVLTLAACNGDQPAKAPDNTAAPTDTSATPPTMAVDRDAASASTDTPPPSTVANAAAAMDAGTHRMASDAPAMALTDDQILQVTHVANQGEIEQAKLALSKTKDARVKKLATMMIKDHTDADAKGLALSKKNGITMAPSAASTDLESSAKDATRTLKDENGSEFDTKYIQTQIQEHQAVLDTIAEKLAPNAKSAGVKAYLAEVQPKVAMHLQHAKDLQTQMTP